jgi:hypothetical protein
MNYAIAVGIYIAAFILGFVLPVLFGNSGSVIRLVISSIPILLVAPRVAQRFTDGQKLLPKEVRSEGGLLYGGGTALIWLGHLAFFGAIGAAIYLAATAPEMVPIGLLAGFAMYPYLLGIVLVELAYRQWSNRQFRQPWKSQQTSIYITVGMIVAAQFVLNLTSDRPVDLLNYSEREALAWGRGYSREVQRHAEKFYIAEKRLPCGADEYIDVESLLRGTNVDRSKALSIEILDCGRFVATIHRTIDGVADGQLLFVASPGDADAGAPLEWQCLSPQLERIERHTNGGCNYDPSLGNISPAPSVAQPTVAPVDRPSRVVADRGPDIQSYLDRLAEPTLWESCGSDATSYRLLRFDEGQYVAAVRISHDSRAASHRTVSSSSRGTIGMDGHVDNRMWARLEVRFDTADFWNLKSERHSSGPDGTRIYMEACKNGTYHAVQRKPDDSSLASIVEIFNIVGKLEWLEK